MSGNKKPTRSELVRYRREQEHLKELQRAATVTSRSTVPMKTRAKQNALKHIRKPTASDRRRFRIALPVMHRPNIQSVSIPRLRLGWRAFSFIMTLILGAMLYLAYNRPELRVTEAQLTGNHLISPAEVSSVLDVTGKPIFLVTPSDLETRLRLNFPELASVRVTVSLPNQIAVDITERQPVIRWEHGENYTWISEDGIAFRPRGELSGLIPVLALSAPAIEGSGLSIPADEIDSMTPMPFISTEMVKALKGLVTHVPPGTQILYDQTFGFGWDDQRGWRVQFGTSANDIELKMLVYESMVNTLSQKGIRPALINVVYPSAPYYRLTE
jgi:hypothetical protein